MRLVSPGIHSIEFSSLPIFALFTESDRLWGEKQTLAKFQFINREFNVENMPFNGNNKYALAVASNHFRNEFEKWELKILVKRSAFSMRTTTSSTFINSKLERNN